MVFERLIDLPREIVWDALVDDALVSGWLAQASIDPRVGGRYDLEWMRPDPFRPTLGTIRELDAPARLVVETSTVGLLAFTLADVPGGTRGRSTALTLSVGMDIEGAFSRPIRAYWLTDLDQLEELLRGHPVDWANWERDHLDDWRAHLAEVTADGA
jgi:uncharacterized protein YndB with AHSA1/START domain